ncbi:DNA helicase MCM9 [Periophthalmus magnuspinnatus]|uniref:DNA helicase MCM9 n=1 Tax=Periophthalmus magnuspinnatus TaxID=409849 RepID=UPI00145ABBD1|nr:DNA helicase MCM9 [Periophthalmus magnuspinnatus]
MAQGERLSSEEEALIRSVFKNYVLEHHSEDITQVITEADVHTHHPIIVNAMNLFEANMEVGDYFNVYPREVLVLFDEVLQQTALELSRNGQQRGAEQSPMCTLHARISGLPVCPELTRDTIPRSRDVGHFLSVTGTVIRTSDSKVLEYQRDYMCAKCRYVFQVSAEFDQFYTFVPPVACPNPDSCESHKFSCLSGDTEPAACRDYQEIKIQEQVQRLSVGSIPRSMLIALEDDLVDSCKSGDDVTVYGIVCQRWKPFTEGSRCDVELILKANHIEVNNQHTAISVLLEEAHRDMEDFWDTYKLNPLAGRDQILMSFCPQIFGMYVVKLAVAMVMAGGVQRIDSTGGKVRGECHMLLVGDPGTGKSQFLKYAAKVMPRSVLTAGIGSTNAGLTVAAVKDGGDWHLEAGALVLSDGGLCCIDEFNSIKEHDRISIHEAMEQQSISVAKAGMVCKLNTRTTILAATNPKGQYDPAQSLSENVALASPLLSRFDLVLVLLDSRNAEWDRTISSFILEDRGCPGQPADSSSLWPIDKMKAYFCLIKRLQPQLSQDANRVLTSYYQLQRQSQGRNARTTIRMLESLSRLAEAHAKLMYRETVTIEDAIMAVSVMECSMQGGALLGSMNALLTSFPEDPVEQYRTQCQLLLEGLHLPQLLQKEMDRLLAHAGS